MFRRCHIYALERNGRCLSENYLNARAPLLWECSEGHRWNSTSDNTVRAGKWCRICAQKSVANEKIKYSIEECNKYAHEHGGKILDYEVAGLKRQFEWVCGNGHAWKATPSQVLGLKTWCKRCQTLEGLSSEISKKLKQKGIEIIKGEIRNSKSLIDMRCALGHDWKSTVGSVYYNDSGCPHCAGVLRLSIKDAQDLAKSKGGICLSNEYKNARSDLDWQCVEGHKWKATFGSVSGGKKGIGTWCPECSHVREPKYSLAFAQNLAKSRNGNFLSSQMNNVLDHYEWECFNGHKWKSTFSSVFRGSWCPSCSRHLGERFTRIAFETLFDQKFPNSRPTWLISDNGTQLSLDGYCESLGIAFEHQGEQHYSKKNYYSNTAIEQSKIKAYDKTKEILCHQHGVNLVIIPEVPRLTSLENLGELIIEAITLENKKHLISNKQKIAYEKAYVEDGRMHRIYEYATERGGDVVEKTYFGMRHRYTWKCSKGHEWKQMADVVVNRGSWCPYCSGRHNISIDTLQNLAITYGGEVLTLDYKKNTQKISCKCKRGHIFSHYAKNLLKGSWCSLCVV